MIRVKRSFRFEASHVLPRHPGKCRNLHGHSFRLTVTVEAPIDPRTGIALDFADLKATVHREVVDRLDHRHLNEILDEPTAENLAVWSWQRLAAALPGLAEVELHETESSSVVYRGQ
jgi:6-pyruvoyltetrahydropterin/6-carboxytetrahydropterin synthase